MGNTVEESALQSSTNAIKMNWTVCTRITYTNFKLIKLQKNGHSAYLDVDEMRYYFKRLRTF